MATDSDWAVLWEQLLSVLGSRGEGGEPVSAETQHEWSELGALLARQAAAALPHLAQTSLAPWEVFAGMFAPAAESSGGKQTPDAASADATAKLFPFPPVGLFHKDQESLKRLHRASLAVNDLYRQYGARMTGLLDDALRLLIERVKEAHARNERVGNARELYDMWVTAGETVFAKLAHSPEFSGLQGQLLNAQSELRQAQQEVMEVWLRHYGLPTRTDVEALHEQIALLRSQINSSTVNSSPPNSSPPKQRSAAPARKKSVPSRKPVRRAGVSKSRSRSAAGKR